MCVCVCVLCLLVPISTTQSPNPSRSAACRPLRIISIGDEGTQDGAKEVLAAMLASQQKQKFGFIIHAGDIRSNF